MIKVPIIRQVSWLRATLLMCLLCFGQTAFAMSEDERQARLEELKSTIGELKQELEKVKNNRGSLLENLETSETRIGELTKKMEELKAQLNDKQAHLTQLRSERTALIHVKKQQQGSVKQHVNAAYRLGQQSNLKLLLNQGDPSTLSRNLKYFDYVLKERAEKIKSYIDTIERLNTIEPEMAMTVANIETRQNDLNRQKKTLQSQYANRKQTLKEIEQLIASKDAKLETLESDRRNLEALFKRVVQVLGEFTVPVSSRPFPALKGQMPWPTKGRLLQKFGSSRVANKITWQGMLISAKEGSPVTAIHHGRVVFSDYLRGQGLLIIIDHGDGFMSLYAHNQTLYKELGDWVNAQEQIAAVGQSGGQNTANLYFELRYKGTPTNPQKWLKSA